MNYGRCIPARFLPLWKPIRVKLTGTLGETITPSATTPWIIVSSSRRPQCLPGMMTLLCHPICERKSTTVPPSLPTWETALTALSSSTSRNHHRSHASASATLRTSQAVCLAASFPEPMLLGA